MSNTCAGFESYLRGSWWEVQIREQRSAMFLVSYKAAEQEAWAWVSRTDLRLSARKTDGWDCYLLKKGAHVSVMSGHPHFEELNLHKEALYDARVSSVTRFDHSPRQCFCKFSVHFFAVKVDTYTDGSIKERILLTDLAETEVSITNIRILQQPSRNMSLSEIFEAHMDWLYIPLNKGCTDAYFLTETDLATIKNPRRPHGERDISFPQVRSINIWSPRVARLLTSDEDAGSNCNSQVNGHTKDILSRGDDTLRTPEIIERNPLAKHPSLDGEEKKVPRINPKRSSTADLAHDKPKDIVHKLQKAPEQDVEKVGRPGKLRPARKDVQKRACGGCSRHHTNFRVPTVLRLESHVKRGREDNSGRNGPTIKLEPSSQKILEVKNGKQTKAKDNSYTKQLVANIQQLTNCSLDVAKKAVRVYGDDPTYSQLDHKMQVMMDWISAYNLETGNENDAASNETQEAGDEDEPGHDFIEKSEEMEYVSPSKKKKSLPTQAAHFPRGNFTGFGVPGYPSIPRVLGRALRGPPFFYFENVSNMPRGEWNIISRYFFHIEPEFTDSKYFSACERQRGYIHNLPTQRRVEILPKAPLTIQELVPSCREHWPSWDTREILSCIVPSRPTEHVYQKVETLLKPWPYQVPPPDIQAKVLDLARENCLVWIKPGGLGQLNVHEAERVMGYDVDHTRILYHDAEKLKCLGNAFQVHTVGYHLSVLKPLYPRGLTVLALFAGIGGAEVALHKAGVPLKTVVSVEINERARRVIAHWWKSSKQTGQLVQEYSDVRQLDKKSLGDLLDRVGGFDLIIGGSPCKELSNSNRDSRKGLEGESSILFFEFPRILNQVREFLNKQKKENAKRRR